MIDSTFVPTTTPTQETNINKVPLTFFRSKFFCGWTSAWMPVRNKTIPKVINVIFMIVGEEKGDEYGRSTELSLS